VIGARIERVLKGSDTVISAFNYSKIQRCERKTEKTNEARHQLEDPTML
jgi:hypothetical protein